MALRGRGVALGEQAPLTARRQDADSTPVDRRSHETERTVPVVIPITPDGSSVSGSGNRTVRILLQERTGTFNTRSRTPLIKLKS